MFYDNYYECIFRILPKLRYKAGKNLRKANREKILMYEYDNDDYSCFDGDENYYITKEDYNHIYGNPITSEYVSSLCPPFYFLFKSDQI